MSYIFGLISAWASSETKQTFLGFRRQIVGNHTRDSGVSRFTVRSLCIRSELTSQQVARRNDLTEHVSTAGRIKNDLLQRKLVRKEWGGLTWVSRFTQGRLKSLLLCNILISSQEMVYKSLGGK